MTASVLSEVDTGLHLVEDVLPFLVGGLNVANPAYGAVGAALVPVFQAAVTAVDTVAADSGQPWEQVLQDVIAHLTPGQPNAPALAPTAAPAAASANQAAAT